MVQTGVQYVMICGRTARHRSFVDNWASNGAWYDVFFFLQLVNHTLVNNISGALLLHRLHMFSS